MKKVIKIFQGPSPCQAKYFFQELHETQFLCLSTLLRSKSKRKRKRGSVGCGSLVSQRGARTCSISLSPAPPCARWFLSSAGIHQGHPSLYTPLFRPTVPESGQWDQDPRPHRVLSGPNERKDHRARPMRIICPF